MSKVSFPLSNTTVRVAVTGELSTTVQLALVTFRTKTFSEILRSLSIRTVVRRFITEVSCASSFTSCYVKMEIPRCPSPAELTVACQPT